MAIGKLRRKWSAATRVVAGALLMGVVCAASAAQGQPLGRFIRPVSALETSSTNSDDDSDFAGGASLKTDPELDQFLKRADQFAEDGRYDLASVLWQRVLDESSGTVMTRDDWTQQTSRRKYKRYRSVIGEIEQTIANLPPAGLRTYRVTADGEAQALLSGAETKGLEEALTQVTSRYFLSSHGDDAAFRLACLRMDRFDFVGASRLLSKVLNQYPDSNIPREDVLLRMAVASARVGDQESAKNAWDKLKDSGAGLSARLVSLIEADLSREGIDKPQYVGASQQWTMPYGNPARTGHMLPLPGSMTSTTMSELWTQDFEMSVATSHSSEYPYQIYEDFDLLRRSKLGRPPQSTTPASRDQMLQRWEQGGWAPAGDMLLAGGKAYFKASDRVVCRDLQTGELVWMGRKNRFQPDKLSLLYMQRGQQLGKPTNIAEVMLFGDRIHQGMAISDGWLFNVEGAVVDDFNNPAPQPNLNQRRGYGYGGMAGRARTNWMAAYDAANGKLKWHRSAGGDDEEGGMFDVGFMAAPVPFARFLIVPVIDGGSLWVYALEKKTGRTAWKSFLCDDPDSGASPWSPVAVAIDGGDAYVSTGAGVIFAIDALNGSTRWAVRYERSGATGNVNPRYRNAYQMIGQIKGWREDMVIPHGKHLVVMASDSDELFALDRRTGEFLWESPRTPYSDVPAGEYCLGVVEDGLFIGGRNIVRRYDIPSGRLRWEAKLDSSLGRGALTRDAIYMPENSTVVRIDLKGGKRLAQVGVFSASKEPVGNLFTDGKRLLALGLGRVYALTDLSYRMDLLAERIKDGDVKSQLERMRLRLREKNHDGALEDLRGAYASLLRKRQVEDAVATLCTGLHDELALTTRDPQLALQLVAEMPLKDTTADKSFPEDILTKRGDLLVTALKRIKDNSVTGAAQEIIDIVPLCSDEHLLRAARSAMESTATPDDADAITKALASPRVGVRTIAMAGLPGALGDKALEPLSKLLKDESDHIKLEAAWTLANTGDRLALAAFGELLDSEDLKVRIRSSKALRALTGQKLPYSAYAEAPQREEHAQAWRDWIAGDGQTARLEFPIDEGRHLLGRTLICYYSLNKVVELNDKGEETWSAEVPYAWGCQGLPNGHRVVASYSGRYVAEYNAEGREIWKKTGLPGAPFSVERLPTGNTLVTCSDSQKVVEIDPDRKIVWEVEISGRPMDARRLENGNTLVALQTFGKVVEVDRSGKVVWEVSDQKGVISASRLENGNTLVCRQAGNMVVEMNRAGEIVWSKGELRNPYDAQRLPNGNTLIVDYNGVQEVNAKGEDVWKRSGNGASRVHRY